MPFGQSLLSAAIWCYEQARSAYSDLEKYKQEFKEQKNNPIDLKFDKFNQLLQEIPEISFNYVDYLRDLELHRTTIQTNSKNYRLYLDKLNKICVVSNNLKFLSNFLELAEDTFVEQINPDLAYLTPGQNLFDQMIGTIRGIVEVEQAKRDRAMAKALREKEEADEEREKKLQLWIALVGTGLAVSGISSQTNAKPVEAILTQLNPSQSLDCPKAGLNPCLFYSGVFVVFHVLVGVIATSVLGLIIWLVSKRKMNN